MKKDTNAPKASHGVHSAGKGSLPRNVNQAVFEANWERIFGKDKKKEEPNANI